MAWRLTYFENVADDVRDAKEWYREQLPGLDKRFAVAVKATIRRIANHPLHYALKYKNIRTALVPVFPYAIHFYIDKEEKIITIIAIVHTSRNPDIPRNRVS
ncbi:hypothetical protein GCM10011386_12390 [Parapedobacter defluvii]|uniref:Type II toxin-antitoxin system RelE/ParE family toxin n=1 Tax=Parapedobacter defluvii TaxID=2045106 RepID=A0ABQ1LAE5_9SPHI|nr:type II toxin-antitoxin system RelE/ParE family toxin [Parapedobacter defluvii]GGC21951.1 hypothetical protein GCM10011386_12390 [Parapedobacter defluvii]